MLLIKTNTSGIKKSSKNINKMSNIFKEKTFLSVIKYVILPQVEYNLVHVLIYSEFNMFFAFCVGKTIWDTSSRFFIK